MNIHCPECRSDAIYKYGLTPGSKQRYICLLCDRQFVANPENIHFRNRPPCPECRRTMHSYMKGPDYIRFRCSDYPRCKTYLKLDEAEFEPTHADMISERFNAEDFFDTIDGKPTWEALHMANEEITASERILLRARSSSGDRRQAIEQYIGILTEFMQFLRSSTKIPSAAKESKIEFRRYWNSIDSKS